MKRLLILLMLFAFAHVSYAQISVESYRMTFELGEISADVLLEINMGSSNITSLKFNTDELSRFRVYDSRGPLEYIINETSSGAQAQVFLKGDSKLFVEFSSEKFIFTSGEVKQFFLDLSLGFEANSVQVAVNLPVGYITDSQFPRGATIISDGSRIIILWEFENPMNLLLSARFKKAEQLSLLPLIGGIILAILAIVAVVHYRKRSHKEFLSGFSEDEVKVIEHLRNVKSAYQNMIEKDFKFSRPKMTRIVKKLEGKNLLEKRRKGRTNRLTWTKGKIARVDRKHPAEEKTGAEAITKDSKLQIKEKEKKQGPAMADKEKDASIKRHPAKPSKKHTPKPVKHESEKPTAKKKPESEKEVYFWDEEGEGKK